MSRCSRETRHMSRRQRTAYDYCSRVSQGFDHGVMLHIFEHAITDIYWEGAPPTDVADRIHVSMPTFVTKLMHQRVTADSAEADK